LNNWNTVLDRVQAACERAGRSAQSVHVIAVTKKVETDKIKEAYAAGARHFGENYVQEVIPKIREARATMPEAKWHFIGALQSNKAKQVVGQFELIHSLDRWSLARELDKESKKQNVPTSVLLEVNIASESSKSGITPSDLMAFHARVKKETSLHVKGLMSFPPLAKNPEESRVYFRKTRELAQQLSLTEISMGVTSDFEVAIEEGATLVRIGTAIFGPRPQTE
jgi:PLP dependent protein